MPPLEFNLNSHLAFIMKHRWLTMAAAFLVVLGFGGGSVFLTTVDVDIRNHFGRGDPRIAALEQMEEIYALSDTMLVVVAPKSGDVFSRDSLIAIEELTEELWLTPYATRVDSITNHSHSEGVEDDLIVERLVDDAATLSDEDLKRIKDVALSTEEIVGRFISADGRVAGLSVNVVLPEDRQAGKLEITDYLMAKANELRARNPEIDYHLTGELILNRAMQSAIDTELGKLGPLAFATMVLLAIILLRSLWTTIAIVIMIIAVLMTALGFAGWAGLKLYGESGAALFVLMAVTVAHSVHIIEAMMAALGTGMSRKQAAVRAIELNVWPVFLTSLTTSIGFLSLNFAEMPPFKVMGNIVAFGTMVAFVFAVTLLPAFLSSVPVKPRRKLQSGQTFFDRFGKFVVSNRTFLLVGFGAISITLIAGISRIQLEENWLELLDHSFEFRRSADFVSEAFSGVEAFEYSLDSGRPGGVTDIEFLNKVEAFAEWYRAQPEIAHVFSIADIMKRLNQNLHGDDPAYYRIPDSSDLAAQYLLLYEFSLPVGRDLNNLIDFDRATTRASVTLRSISTAHKLVLEERAQEWFDQNAPELKTSATGMSLVGAYSTQRNIKGMLVGTAVAMSVVTLLLFIVFKSFRLGLVSTIPNFIPAAIALGSWGYLVSEVGLAAAVVTAIAFGIIVDDTIHFMTKYVAARKRGLMPSESVRSTFRSVGRALLVTTIVFALGFLVFSASGMIANQTLGVLVGITVIIALVADFLFLPPVLMLLDGTKETSQEIKERMLS